MAVKTPECWKEAEYQPLVEVETAYGNKVKIPESSLILWQMYRHGKNGVERHREQFEREIAAGLYQTKDRRYKRVNDLRKVFVEKYHE